MFDEIDRAYFERRAQEERERALAASDASVVRTHEALALEYERRAKVSAAPVSQ